MSNNLFFNIENIEYKELLDLFNTIPGIQFWIKDKYSRFIKVNKGFLDNYLLNDEEQIIGKTDYDLSPAYIADQFKKDDEEVLKGRSIYNRIELVCHFDQSIDWFVTNKRPLRNKKNIIVGTMGITRKLDIQKNYTEAGQDFQKVLQYIHANLHENLDNSMLAQKAHLSKSAFERKFHRIFHISPGQYIKKLRIQFICKDLVYSNETIIQLAMKYGFCDESYMIKEFRKLLNTTPHQYRKQYSH